jgi:hypothetical protein
MAFVKNTHKSGNQHIGGKQGMLAPGDIKEVDDERLPKICGEFVRECDSAGNLIEQVTVVKRRRGAPAKGSGEKFTGSEEEQKFLAQFPADLTKDQANAITTFYEIGDRELGKWLKDGEVEGAAKTGDANNAPWSIPKAGLLARIMAEKQQ